MNPVNEKTYALWRKLHALSEGKISAMIDAGVGHPDSEAWFCRSDCAPDTPIIGFEPNSSRFEEVSKTYPGTVFNSCLGDRIGFLEGHTGKPQYPASHSDFKIVVEDGGDEHYEECSMPVMTGDYVDMIFGGLGDDIILWADIEGSELIALTGCAGLLQSKRISLICLELLDIYDPNLKADTLKFLAGYGYRELHVINNVDFIFGR